MKIPKVLNIGGQLWTVQLSKAVCREGNCSASAHYKEQKIFLDPETTQRSREKALIHEILHVVWEQSGLGARPETKDREEEIIKSLSYGVYQALRENRLNFGMLETAKIVEDK